MYLEEAVLKKILVDESYVAKDDMLSAEKYAKQYNVPLTDYLLTKNLLDKDLLGQAIAEYFKVDYADLNSNIPSAEQIAMIPEDLAKKFRLILFKQNAKQLVITTDNPQDKTLLPTLAKTFPKIKITINYSLPEDIDALLNSYQKPLETRFAAIIKDTHTVAPEILDEIFSDALTYNASDIHFEPQGPTIVVRFRVDGLMREAGRLPRMHYESILNRVKVRSGLRIDEHFSAQDGSMQHLKENLTVDMRTSIIPTIEGEKIVLRVLNAYIKRFTLNDIGLSAPHQKLLETAANKPFGMILVSGPTGSGKTTTLYTVLQLLNQPDVNITTIEDPVEYKIRGVNQIQVNIQTNLTFAKGLRSIVRQDPDIVLVGEIRDHETAEIAVNAALTGHLLLSTFHANDAATSIPRLLNMGIEPFLLASTLNIIIAQRLTRKICEHCRYSLTYTPTEMKSKYPDAAKFFTDKKITMYQGKGCTNCGQSGYKGQTALFEFIAITPQMQELIIKSPSAQAIWVLARAQGSQSMFEDGLDKVKKGITTLDELLRVTEPPQNTH